MNFTTILCGILTVYNVIYCFFLCGFGAISPTVSLCISAFSVLFTAKELLDLSLAPITYLQYLTPSPQYSIPAAIAFICAAYVCGSVFPLLPIALMITIEICKFWYRDLIEEFDGRPISLHAWLPWRTCYVFENGTIKSHQ